MYLLLLTGRSAPGDSKIHQHFCENPKSWNWNILSALPMQAQRGRQMWVVSITLRPL